MPQNLLSSLTQKEFIILEQVLQGLSNQEIASQENISVYTVKRHRQNIMEKLGIKGKAKMTKFIITTKIGNLLVAQKNK